MPGSIHVSVLDFSELPSSSPSSSILIKASMGKRDRQTWGKGDFSLPLTSLRDNVIITLHDAEGNELSKAGVRIISIVEKGYLDESLSLEGGGIVRLKLRFVLNDEERNKIQRMRESAMKRKRDELLSVSPRYSKIASTSRETVTPSSCDNHEVSDSQASVSQHEVLKIGDQAIQSREGNEGHMKEIIPYDANGSDISKGVQLLSDEYHNTSEEKIETREENSTRLVDKEDNEMDQNDVSNTYVTKDDSLDEKIETSLENNGGLFENNVKEMRKIDAPKIPEILKDGLSFSSGYLDTPEVNKVVETLEKTPTNVRKMNKRDESENASVLYSISRGVHLGDQNLNKTNEKMKNSEENKSEKNEMKLDPIKFPQRSTNSEETSSNLKKDVAAFEVKNHVEVQIEKREPLQKTSSSVRKMISAFESTLFKEMKPIIKPPPTKTLPEKVGLEALKDIGSVDNTKPTKLLSSKIKTPLVDEKSKPKETDGIKSVERIGFELSQDSSHLEEPFQTQAKETEERSKDNTKLTKLLSIKVKTPLVDEKSKPIETDGMKYEENIGTDSSQDASCLEEPSFLQTQAKETEERSKDNTKLTKPLSSKVKTPLVDEKSKQIETDGMKTKERTGTGSFQDASCIEESSMIQTQVKKSEAITKKEEDLVNMFTGEELNQNHPLNPLVLEESGCDSADIGIPKIAILSSNSLEDSIGKTLENDVKTIDSCENDFSSGETLGAWIFPDEGARVSIMTEIKQVNDSAKSYSFEERLPQGFSLSENMEKDNRNYGIHTDVNNSGKTNSSKESSPGAETSSGPFGQVIKIAVMVAFGSLILLSRPRMPR